MLADSHAHLEMLPDAVAAVEEARAAGVTGILTVGTDAQSCREASGYADRLPGVFASVGFHPHGAAGFSDADLDLLGALAGEEAVVAIGETGLDYFRDRSPRDRQQEVFRKHISLARDTKLPLIVHSRDSAEDTLSILDEDAGGVTVVLHCFALAEHVEECAERGYFMSIAGNVSYKNAASLRQAAGRIPAELLLTETDSPYLTPEPHRGKPNCPAYVVHVADALADIRGVSVPELADTTRNNFLRAFGISS